MPEHSEAEGQPRGAEALFTGVSPYSSVCGYGLSSPAPACSLPGTHLAWCVILVAMPFSGSAADGFRELRMLLSTGCCEGKAAHGDHF